MNARAELRPVSLADLEPLTVAAAADNHAVLFPSHVAVRDGEMVGYASVGMVPLVFAWAHTRKMSARESFRLLREVEALAATASPVMVLPCAATSPFHPLLPRLGYRRLGAADWMVKNLRST